MADFDLQTLWPMVLFAAVLLVMFWFIVIRPVHVQQRRHKELLASVSEGDRIATAGGIYGTIVRLREDEVDVEVTDGCVITFDRRAVRRIVD